MIERLRAFLALRLYSTLCGVSFGDWLHLLCRHNFRVDPPYWPRAAVITLLSAVNSLWRWLETRTYAERLAEVKVEAPLFILGHWRSGTTHLQNLLAADPQFVTPNTYQVLNPHTFLLTEGQARLWSFLIPRSRLIDNMANGFHVPQEDEFALCAATFLSPYMSEVFKGTWDLYERYLTFRGVPAEEVCAWKDALLLFARKLVLKHRRALVLKSPPHTCRLRLLLELFPDARFVHIRRDPYAVFRSMKQMLRIAGPIWQLGRSQERHRDERILECYRVMYDAYFEERALIPPGRLHELVFEDLEKDPVGEMRALYAALGLPGFEGFEPALRRYVESLAGYRKNPHQELTPAQRQAVARSWGRSFKEWGYAI